eukprot:786645_1
MIASISTYHYYDVLHNHSLLNASGIQTNAKYVFLYSVINFWSQETKCGNQLINDVLSVSPAPLPTSSPWSMENSNDYKNVEVNVHSAKEAEDEYPKAGLWVALG